MKTDYNMTSNFSKIVFQSAFVLVPHLASHSDCKTFGTTFTRHSGANIYQFDVIWHHSLTLQQCEEACFENGDQGSGFFYNPNDSACNIEELKIQAATSLSVSGLQRPMGHNGSPE